MKFCSVPAPMRAISLTLAVVLYAAGSARAQVYQWQAETNPLHPNLNPTVSVSYTNALGNTVTDSGIPAEGFSVSNTSGGSSVLAFCIDLYHVQSLSNFSPVSGGVFLDTATSPHSIGALLLNPITPTAPSTMVNELNYLGSLTTALSGANQIGAMQLAIWSVIDGNDPHFSLSFGSSTVLQADYNVLAGKLGLKEYITGQGTSDFGSISTYSSGTSYAAGTVIQVNSGPNDSSGDQNHQNLITWGSSSGILLSATPEPSSLAIAGLGALAFAGYGLRRRKAMHSKSAVRDAEISDADASDSLPAISA
jgi:hypothetical protein